MDVFFRESVVYGQTAVATLNTTKLSLHTGISGKRYLLLYINMQFVWRAHFHLGITLSGFAI